MTGEVRAALERAISFAHEAGNPFTRYGVNSLSSRQDELNGWLDLGAAALALGTTVRRLAEAGILTADVRRKFGLPERPIIDRCAKGVEHAG